jgi:cation/acetate symporter
LLKRTLKPDISDKQELLAARLAAMVAIVISAYFGINPPGFVASVVAFAFGLAAASFFPAIIMGIFSKKMNKEGAIAGMVTGITFTAAYIIYFKFVGPANWLFGISPEGIGLVGMIINFAVAGIVLKLTAETPVEIQEMVEGIRNPKGSSAAHAH